MTVVAEPYLETEPFGLVSDRLTTSPYVMPFKPMPGVADEASVCVLLDDAIHYSPQRAFISASWLGVSVWMPKSRASLHTPSMKMLISRVSNSLEPLYTR